VSDFVPNGFTKLGIHGFLLGTVANSALVEIGAVANVAGVLVRPADETVIAIGWLHGGNLEVSPGLFNGLCHLALLVNLGVVALAAADRHYAIYGRVLELSVRALLAIQEEARFPQIGNQFTDFAGHGRGWN
jgi:hypothetical protein